MLLQERLDRNVSFIPFIGSQNTMNLFVQTFQHSYITTTTMVNMTEHHSEMDMGSPPRSPPSMIHSMANMQEMDMEQDDDDMNASAPPPSHPQLPPPPRGAPSAPMMISRIPANQPPMPPPLPPGISGAFPSSIPTDRLSAPLKPQDVIIKSYNPKGKSVRKRSVRIILSSDL